MIQAISPELDEMLTIKDIKENLGIGTVKAYELAKLKSFPAIRIGGSIRVPKQKYLKWIEQNVGKTVFV